MNKKTVFITGATSGIGKLVAERCVHKGYIVYATGRNKVALHSLSKIGCHTIQADLNQHEQLKQVCDQLPKIDVAILNAGVGYFQNIYDLEDEQIQDMLNINVQAPIFLTKYIAKKMIDRKQGHIIIISSQAGKVPVKKSSVYASTKHAMTGFINGIRMELKDYNIKVTGIYPGPIDTPFIDKADFTGNYKENMERFMLKPEFVAEKVVKTIEKPVREINLPWYSSLTSKLYATVPKLTEVFGKSFFEKK